MAEETYYTVKQSSLTAVADAIREKSGGSQSLGFPNGFVSEIGNISGGSGDEQLFIFCNSIAYLSAGAIVNNYLSAVAVYYGADLVSGVTVTFYTYGDYILTGVTGRKSGDIIPFTTVERGTYTFTMPSESVNCTLQYDD